MFKKFSQDEAGATAVEYALIIALVVAGIFMYIAEVENGGIHVLTFFGGITTIIAVIWLIPKLIERSDTKKDEKQKSAKREELATTKRNLIAAAGAKPSHFQAKKTSKIILSEKPIYDVFGDVWKGLKLEIDNASLVFTSLEPKLEAFINEEAWKQESSLLKTHALTDYQELKGLIKRFRQFFMIDSLVWSADLLPKPQVSRYVNLIGETQSLEKKIKPLLDERADLALESSKNTIKLRMSVRRLKQADTYEHQMKVDEIKKAQKTIRERRISITTEIAPIESKISALKDEKESLQTLFVELLVPYETVPDSPSSDMLF